MSYNEDHYRMDRDGSFASEDELNRAASNGHVRELSNGNYYDDQTGDEYYSDGTRK